MKWLKEYKLFESNSDDLEETTRYILMELSDIGLEVTFHDLGNIKGEYKNNISIYIKRPFRSPNRRIEGAPEPPGGQYPGDIFLWMEIKDAIIRLVEWYYSTDSAKKYHDEIQKMINNKTLPKNYRDRLEDRNALRLWNSGVEFACGVKTEKDFEKIGDFISFTSLKILMKK
jgi:hypothetical protein